MSNVMTTEERKALVRAADRKDFGLLLLAGFGVFVGGLGALGMFSAFALEDGGALFFSILAIAFGVVTFNLTFKKKPAFAANPIPVPAIVPVSKTVEETTSDKLKQYVSTK